MNKEEFLKRLEQLLSDISEEERADALAFYRSYFEDAGIGNEASILEELESPEKRLMWKHTRRMCAVKKLRHIQKKHLEMVRRQRQERMIHI